MAVRLRWRGRFPASEYRVYRNPAATAFDLEALPAALATIVGDKSEYLDETSETATAYRYLLAAVNDNSPEDVAFSEVVITDTAAGADPDPGPGGGDVGDAVYLTYQLTTTYTLSSFLVPQYTTLVADDGTRWDTTDRDYTVPAGDDGKLAILTHSALFSGEDGAAIIIYIDKALAASPTSFGILSSPRLGNGMGITLSRMVLLAEGDVYRFSVRRNSGATANFESTDVRNRISIEIIDQVT